MRRMMHAALIASALISSVSSVYAQAPQNSLIVNGAHDGIQYSAPVEGSHVYSEAGLYGEVSNYSSGSHGATYSQDATYSSVPSAGPQFLKYGSCRPHSSIATLMQREYISPNLWAGYSQQRAALIGHMMRHVDGTCDCCQTYDSACCSGGGAGACGTAACGSGPVGGNRYKLSTLHASPSSECGDSCGTGSCGTGVGFGKLHGWKHSDRPYTFGSPVDPSCSSCSSETFGETAQVPYASPYAANLNVPQQVAPQPASRSAANSLPPAQANYRTR